MSSIASLHVARISDLPAIAGDWDTVDDLGREIGDDYSWSGYVMFHVLDGLSEADVVLESPRLRAEAEALDQDLDVTLISAEAKALLDRLDPAAHQTGDLLEGLTDLGLDDEESRYALEDTLGLLRTAIAGLADDEMLLISIG